jgi:hypothetical protein
MDRDLATMVPSRGKRRAIRAQVLGEQKAARKKEHKPDPTRRPPVVVRVKRARRVFTPGGFGHTNAMMVGILGVAKEIARRGPQAACATGYGDKKQRRKLTSKGLADTTTLSKSWRTYWKLFTKEARDEATKAQKAETRRKSMNPFKRGLQWLKDKAVTRGQR